MVRHARTVFFTALPFILFVPKTTSKCGTVLSARRIRFKNGSSCESSETKSQALSGACHRRALKNERVSISPEIGQIRDHRIDSMLCIVVMGIPLPGFRSPRFAVEHGKNVTHAVIEEHKVHVVFKKLNPGIGLGSANENTLPCFRSLGLTSRA